MEGYRVLDLTKQSSRMFAHIFGVYHLHPWVSKAMCQSAWFHPVGRGSWDIPGWVKASSGSLDAYFAAVLRCPAMQIEMANFRNIQCCMRGHSSDMHPELWSLTKGFVRKWCVLLMIPTTIAESVGSILRDIISFCSLGPRCDAPKCV